MRTIRWTLAALATVAALGPGLASAHKPKPKRHCARPAGWTVVGRDSLAIVITGKVNVSDVDGAGTPGQEYQWRYCLYKQGRFHVLVTNAGAQGGFADVYSVARVVLAGDYIAYDSYDDLGGGRYGVDLGVDVTNVLTGRNVSGQVIGVGFVRILLAPPFAAWISSTEQPDWFVQALNGQTGKTTTLDSTCPPPFCSMAGTPDPFGNLQLARCVAGCTPPGATFAWWTRDGMWRSAPVS